ncbi:Tim10/DDP family zinc finger-domain-containing protein [Xylariaceae sp. FL0255]|nr:Tim10/DDP family zinc finger-domain-containing protein [Xylariaceae sp. FL0255]
MDSEQIKTEVMRQVRQQYSMDNARQLLEKINEHCFERCVPKPGTSLSSGEQTCFTSCMEKYISAWNSVNQTVVSQAQQNLH